MFELHSPVLLKESIDALQIKPDGIYLDGTLGRCGHSLEILKNLGKNGQLIAIDRDLSAISFAESHLSAYSDKLTILHNNYSNIKSLLLSLNLTSVDGMLFDLGVSSPQLDDHMRGFSYVSDAPLDMRMDTSGGITASDIINSFNELELRNLFYKYGEERYSARIAATIVKARRIAPILSTTQLSSLISSAMPAKALREKQHPAKRCFQALRIAVNDELKSLEIMLSEAPDMLSIGGRIVVISFHSLEDRLVKNAFKARETGCICPPGLPQCGCGFKQTLKRLTKKPITPSEYELSVNPRSRSAKLRVAEKC